MKLVGYLCIVYKCMGEGVKIVCKGLYLLPNTSV